MFGKFLSRVVKVATLPLDVAEVVLDKTTGGDGSRRELKRDMPCLSNLRDSVCDTLEKADE